VDIGEDGTVAARLAAATAEGEWLWAAWAPGGARLRAEAAARGQLVCETGDLVREPRLEHAPHPRVDPAVDRLDRPVEDHREEVVPARRDARFVPRRASIGRAVACGVRDLKRARDAAAVVRMKPRRGGRVARRETGVEFGARNRLELCAEGGIGGGGLVESLEKRADVEVGAADHDRNAAATLDVGDRFVRATTPYSIASMSKYLTALGAMRVAEASPNLSTATDARVMADLGWPTMSFWQDRGDDDDMSDFLDADVLLPTYKTKEQKLADEAAQVYFEVYCRECIL
jgi:hypothetical protein